MPIGPRYWPVGGGGALPEYVQITATEQASDAIVDPGGYTTTGTGLSAGVFKWVVNTTPAVVNGYRENCPKWSMNLLTLIPDFDINKSIVDIAITNITGLGLGSSTGVGLFTGIFSDDAANIAAINGGGVVVYDFNAANHQIAIIAATAAGAGGAHNNFGGTLTTHHRFVATGFQAYSHHYLTTTPGVYSYDSAVHGYSATMGSDPSTWSIHLALTFFSAIAINKTVTCKLWYRHILTTGAP